MGSVPICRAFQIDCKGGRFNLTLISESQSSIHLLQFWTTIRVDLPWCCTEDMLTQSSLNYIMLWWSHLAILKLGLTCKTFWLLLPKNDVELGWDIISVAMFFCNSLNYRIQYSMARKLEGVGDITRKCYSRYGVKNTQPGSMIFQSQA